MSIEPARHSRISGTGSHLPPQRLTNADLVARLAGRGIETTDAWIVERTGIRARHFAAEDAVCSDLAVQAARQALDSAGVDAATVDLIIVATSTPDMIFPSTACLVQVKLGIAGCAAFDIQAVCSGFVYGLTVADAMIRSGAATRALVIGAEIFSRILDFDDRTTCVLFGDGAGAVVLSAADTPGILGSRLHADGSHLGILSVPGQVRNGVVTGSPFVAMEGNAVFRFAVRVLADVVDELLPACGLARTDIDWLIPHQANVRIIESAAKRLGLSMEKVVVTVDLHGNTSAASIPLALDVAVRDGRIRSGHNVILEGVGGGFTWGAVAVRW